ncbi:Uncharacterised protein [Mycobacterium tuberculosis]|nr:Uncharacterised protein [Mycobacterium tuberculosis]
MPPLPYKMPPGPPACPVPGEPSAPLPISGRPNSAWVGALTAASKLCSTLTASAATYELAAADRVCTNRS